MDDKSDDVDLPSEETDGSRGCSPRPPGTPARLPFPRGTLLDPLLSPGASTWEHVPCSLQDWGGLSGPPRPVRSGRGGLPWAPTSLCAAAWGARGGVALCADFRRSKRHVAQRAPWIPISVERPAVRTAGYCVVLEF